MESEGIYNLSCVTFARRRPRIAKRAVLHGFDTRRTIRLYPHVRDDGGITWRIGVWLSQEAYPEYCEDPIATYGWANHWMAHSDAVALGLHYGIEVMTATPGDGWQTILPEGGRIPSTHVPI